MLKNLFKKVAVVTTAVTLLGGVGANTAFAAEPTTASAKSTGSTTATAAATTTSTDNATITITLPKTQGQESNTSAATGTTYEYKVYKVFDATQATTGEGNDQKTSISYKVMSGKNGALPTSYGNNYSGAKFYKDSAGNVYYGTVSDSEDSEHTIAVLDGNSTKYLKEETTLTDGAVDAVAAYATANSAAPVADVSVASTFTSLEITGLAYGYYYVTTTTGSVVAVNSTQPNATVGDKNTVPSVSKKITGVKAAATDTTDTAGSHETSGENAIAEYGSTVEFESIITVGKGAVGYVYKDKMSTNLSLNAGDNNANIKVYKNSETTAIDSSNYTIYKASTFNKDSTTDAEKSALEVENDTPAQTFAIVFTDNYIKGLSAGDTLTVKYSATVTSDSFTTTAETNTAKVTYNNNDTVTDTVNVYSAKITVTKTFENVNSNYPTAGFVLRRGEGTQDSPYEYYKIDSQNKDVSWVQLTNTQGENKSDAELLKAEIAKADAQRSITELTTSTSSNVLTFTGLADGTYTLIETTTPAGYNTAATQEFTIKAATSTDADKYQSANLEKTATVENKAGTVLPSTGGIGTTIFYVIGGVLVLGATILLVARKRRKA